mmetsp:Transcript_1315/g.3479  ORF Transcript_1315/g.3479 Transcript_1315/m.3479 type:complete len:226 (+) Transcript_1315:592-1269(+)
MRDLPASSFGASPGAAGFRDGTLCDLVADLCDAFVEGTPFPMLPVLPFCTGAEGACDLVLPVLPFSTGAEGAFDLADFEDEFALLATSDFVPNLATSRSGLGAVPSASLAEPIFAAMPAPFSTVGSNEGPVGISDGCVGSRLPSDALELRRSVIFPPLSLCAMSSSAMVAPFSSKSRIAAATGFAFEVGPYCLAKMTSEVSAPFSFWSGSWGGGGGVKRIWSEKS